MELKLTSSYSFEQNIWNKVKKCNKVGHDYKAFIFWQLLPKFNFWDTDCALGSISTQIWDVSNIYELPGILSLNLFDSSRGNFYTMFIIRYQVSFYFWRIGPILKHWKVPKYNDQNWLKSFSFALHTSNYDSGFWSNYAQLTQKD